jgi:hypothetical protein
MEPSTISYPIAVFSVQRPFKEELKTFLNPKAMTANSHFWRNRAVDGLAAVPD